jgi:hypothetical protein
VAKVSILILCCTFNDGPCPLTGGITMKQSWRTTLSGVFTGIALLLGQALTLLDNDPKTNLDFTVIMAAFGMFSLGFTARDENVTSEQAGLK